MKMLCLVSILLSSSYALSPHPIVLMTLILAQALMICMLTWLSTKSSWFSFVLFLIFLGGLMVLFIYITSLASNELMALDQETGQTIICITATTYLILLTTLNAQPSLNMLMMSNKSFTFLYSWNVWTLTIATMIYLLLTLIIVVKICDKFEAPLKNLIFN